jgi:hypothetical protein
LFDHSRALCAIAYRKCSENRYDIDPDAQEQRTTKLELSIQQPALLIVEDHAPMRAALRDLLALCGRALHVLEAADGAAEFIAKDRIFTELPPLIARLDPLRNNPE